MKVFFRSDIQQFFGDKQNTIYIDLHTEIFCEPVRLFVGSILKG